MNPDPHDSLQAPIQPMNKLLAPLALLALVLASCSSIQYDDPNKVETVNMKFGSTDLQSMADGMVQSLLISPNLQYIDHSGKADDKRVVLLTGSVQNRTSEHIDTSSITDSIRTALQKSGRFRLAASNQGQDELGTQVRFQMESGRVDPNLIRQFGKQIGADAVMYGNLRSIEKSKDRNLEDAGRKTDDVYYKLTLEVVNIESGEVVWIDEKEVRKSKKTGLFGG
ncbi:MAG: penicillin-binding protein activator LpoB [Planctomycetes bacterium]|nr:penicillin-binding protein activator LpoB [Planctomycetota bacterium]